MTAVVSRLIQFNPPHILTFTGSRTLAGTLCDNSSTSNLSFIDTMLNEGIRVMLGDIPWPFLEKTQDETTVASQQSYKLPGDLYKMVNVFVKVGTYKYTPTQVTSFDDWNRLNNPTGVTSDNVSFYFILGQTIEFWPTPANNSNTITFQYLQATKDISVADYTTGSITTAVNGSKTITGSGTSWTAGMAGRWLRITAGSAANLGDGLWYQVASVDSTTQLTLVREYNGTAITTGTAAYTLGDCSIIPEKYQLGPVYYAASEYWRKNDDSARADRYEQKFVDILTRMKHDEGTKTSDVVIDDGGYMDLINPNLNRSATSA